MLAVTTSSTGDSSDGASATESVAPVVDGCEVEVQKSDRVFEITTEAAEAALAAAEVEATSVDVSLEPGGTTCRISWEDAGKGGLLTIGTPGPGSSDLTGEPGAYDVGPWTCLTADFGSKTVGGQCSDGESDLIVILKPATGEPAARAVVESVLPTLDS